MAAKSENTPVVHSAMTDIDTLTPSGFSAEQIVSLLVSTAKRRSFVNWKNSEDGIPCYPLVSGWCWAG
jgi:hypothetical protein